MLSQKQTMLRKKIKKVKRVTTRRKEMLSHLHSPQLLRKFLGHLYLKHFSLKDYKHPRKEGS
jgi:hypothetical protein